MLTAAKVGSLAIFAPLNFVNKKLKFNKYHKLCPFPNTHTAAQI
jgi:hypothetical protein